MRSARLAAAGTITSLALVACGGGDGGAPAGGATPNAVKPRTLTAAEYPVMREYIITEGSDVAEIRALCRTLDAGPDTAVVEAARDACDRVLSLTIDINEAKGDADDCDTGDRACVVGILRSIERQLNAIYDALIDFNGEVEAVLASGPCRDALTQPDEVTETKQILGDYERAVDAFEGGDDDALDSLEEQDDDVDDPTPCRPRAGA